MSVGKKHVEGAKKVDRSVLYSPNEALKLLKDIAYASFDESVELHFKLGIDPRQSDQQLRGTLTLPHGTGKKVIIAVVTNGENLSELESAGADFVGSDDLIDKIRSGWLGFDLLITTPEMMSKLGKLGKVLGSKGLMPNPKSGTVTPHVLEAVKAFKAGKLEYRNDKTGIVHLIIGKKSFDGQQLFENLVTVYETIQKVKPVKSKGVYVESISLSSTMSPGIFIEPLRSKWKEA